jgi:hypothetical protein
LAAENTNKYVPHVKPLAPGAHHAHSTEQRTQSGGIERWTDPTVVRPCVPWQDLSVNRRARVLLENGLGQFFVTPISSASVHFVLPLLGSNASAHRAVLSSARRAEMAIGLQR